MTLASASERIRLMEESLSAPLLERHCRGVRATPAGAALVHHAQLVIQQLERMRGELSEYADGFGGRVRLFANTTATVNAGEKMHRRAGVKLHYGRRSVEPFVQSAAAQTQLSSSIDEPAFPSRPGITRARRAA
jgi:hypothetical protein